MAEYSVKVNNELIKAATGSKSNLISIHGNSAEFSVRKVCEHLFTISTDNRVIEVVIVSRSKGNYILLIEGDYYFVRPKTKLEELTEKILAGSESTSQSVEITAPMPGLIIDLMVSQGVAVREGDHLLVLEAMKMENVIKSPINGIVSQIKKSRNESVDKGEILFVLKKKFD